ncbi:beta-1,3-galactosyltransferase brn [Leptopilina boulardi]|uniref:beta-1,3-galactosyltransferase brn n=1 Tax=Leptopilina boulardi TaxID=63433 RepID=UPI0021F60961|nr:beta-1,3-galactosyltransferase brn [Leptopilina boulardi]XP_051167888.1 beta-1,3-galactosyltransferase brn [Leptopilina boulardi]XP_051167889.1 beta-1,3-galactosyltransferase brn [Leptopilina boulardi]
MYVALRVIFHRILRLLSRIKLKYIILLIISIALLDVFGAFTHIFEITYDENFSYPYDGDIQPSILLLRNKEKPELSPINEYNQTFIITPQRSCNDVQYQSLRVVYLVKSSVDHFNRRAAIRSTWGLEKRFFDVSTRTVFLLGIRPDDEQLKMKIKLESQKFQDIIQADFIDSYFNNTIKTMIGFKWAVEQCSMSKFYMFIDDDMYVSVKNVLRFVRNPTNYPDYRKETRRFGVERKREIRELETSDDMFLNIQRERRTTVIDDIELNKTKIVNSTEFENINNKSLMNDSRELKNYTIISERRKRQVFDFELPDDVRLYAGFVFISSPHRHRTSKWYVSLEEYPYHLWPPYVTAGSYILSREALIDMYYTSFYTKHFRFDDIYLGFVAKKAEIQPFHCGEFHFYKKDYNKYNYKYVITSHGYENPDELLQIWNEQKALGNA